MESVASGRPLLRTLGKHLLCPFTNPRRFFATRPVFVVWTLYSVSYFTANVTNTLVERHLQADQVLTGTLVSAAVFAVNTPLGIWKDVRFAQFFGSRLAAAGASTGASSAAAAAAVRRSMPMGVSASFLVRDIITVFGSFALAPLAVAAIPESVSLGATTLAVDRAAAAQLLVPAATQIAATPAHLLALDLYNRPTGPGIADRARKVRSTLPSTTVMRAVRLVPAFGVGIIMNSRLRLSLRGDKQDG